MVCSVGGVVVNLIVGVVGVLGVRDELREIGVRELGVAGEVLVRVRHEVSEKVAGDVLVRVSDIAVEEIVTRVGGVHEVGVEGELLVRVRDVRDVYHRRSTQSRRSRRYHGRGSARKTYAFIAIHLF
jgi:hypothetical protein